MALFFDKVSTAQLVERPHGLVAEGFWVAASTLPCAILVLSVVLVLLSFVRRRLEMSMAKHAGAAKRQYVGTSHSLSPFRLLCQSFNVAHATPKDQLMPRSMMLRSTRLRWRRRQGSVDCCLFQATGAAPGCEVALRAEEKLQACKLALPVSSSKAPPVPISDGQRSAAKTSGGSRGSDCETLVAVVATDAGGIEAPPGLGRCRGIDDSMVAPPFGDVVEGTTAAEAKDIAVGGRPQTTSVLRPILRGKDHAASSLIEASSSAWGCAVQRVYSNALFLAHRSVYLKISDGAPGLQRIQGPSPASVWQSQWSVMPKTVPADVVGSCNALQESAAVENLCPRTKPLNALPSSNTSCTKLLTDCKRRPSHHRFASVSPGPAMRSQAKRRTAAKVLGPPPGVWILKNEAVKSSGSK